MFFKTIIDLYENQWDNKKNKYEGTYNDRGQGNRLLYQRVDSVPVKFGKTLTTPAPKKKRANKDFRDCRMRVRMRLRIVDLEVPSVTS